MDFIFRRTLARGICYVLIYLLCSDLILCTHSKMAKRLLRLLHGLPAMQGSQLDVRQALHYGFKLSIVI